MIVIADRNGQLGNRLFTFAHFIGWALEHGAEIANPGFFEYAQYFGDNLADPWCRFPVRPASRGAVLSRQIVYPAIYFAARQARKFQIRTPWLSTLNYRGDSVYPLDIHTDELLSCKLTLVREWQYRDDANFHKHRDAICAYFTPRSDHLRRIRESVAKARDASDVLVGVHIRRGDYIKHLGGRYFYDHRVYRQAMEKIRGLFENRNVGFLICSNEQVDVSLFDGFNLHLGPNHLVEDMYSFAGCDYLVGPPSTYTLWASYYGKVPLLQMHTPICEPKLEDFEIH